MQYDDFAVDFDPDPPQLLVDPFLNANEKAQFAHFTKVLKESSSDIIQCARCGLKRERSVLFSHLD